MNLAEIEAKAHEIAERAIRLSPTDGDDLIRKEADAFPAHFRELLLLYSAKFAEQKRIENDLRSILMQDTKGERALRVIGCCAGVVLLFTALGVVIFLPRPTVAQWFVVRLMAGLGAAAFSPLISGYLQVKGTLGKIAIAAGAGFGMFVLTYLFNPGAPAPLPLENVPVEKK